MTRRTFAIVAALLSAATAAAQTTADHLECYKVKDPLAKATYTADLAGLVVEPGCTIKIPAQLACVPTAKTNVDPSPSGGGGTGVPHSFFCYKLKCPKATLPPVTGQDQFASRTAAAVGSRLLCAPMQGPSTGSSPLPATGQTTCWDSAGTVIACAGTGQDGELRKGGALAYADNGDGTITDLNTGLVWEKQSMDGGIHDATRTFLWQETFSVHVAALNAASFAGHADWRVPNVRELASIVHYEAGSSGPPVAAAFNTGCVDGCTVLECSCTGYGGYWTSTTSSPAPSTAWFVYFTTYGEVFAQVKSTARLSVRAVRGGN